MGLLPLPIVLVLLQISLCVGAESYNATTDANAVVGVYPISGQYGLLNRLLFYVLWIFVVCAEKWTWLVLGALAYNMTYSATAAVHALVLAVVSIHGLYDLDAIGAWAILSVAATITVPILWTSDRLRDSVYRPVFGFWSTVVGVGCICLIAAVFREYPEEQSCWSTTARKHHREGATLLTSPTQLLTPGEFDCTYTFFNSSQPLRSRSEITVVPDHRAFGSLFTLFVWGIVLTVYFGMLIALFGFCFIGERRRTKAELIKVQARRIPKDATPKQKHRVSSARRRAEKELVTGKYQGLRFPRVCLYLDALIVTTIAIFNEVYILAQQHLPESESVYAVGQWGPWVTVGLALIAAAINAWYTPRWERLKKTLDSEQEQRIEENKRKAIPQIHLDPMTSPLSHDVELGLLKQKREDDLSATRQPLSNAQSAIDQSGNHAVRYPGPVLLSPERTTAGDTAHIEETTLREATVLQSNTPRICFRVPRQRHRLNHIKYDPPFTLQALGVNMNAMPLQQYDVACSAYDEVGSQHDGIIIRDIEGRDWIVQKGLLWHRELWEPD